MSEMRKWIRTARCEDIPLREGRSVKLGAREVAIFNLGDRFLAVANHCPHRNGPLAEGIVSGQSVVCPLHAWKVDLETGRVERPADSLACLEKFRVRVQDDVVLVEVPMPSASHRPMPDCHTAGDGPHSASSATCGYVDESEFGNVNL